MRNKFTSTIYTFLIFALLFTSCEEDESGNFSTIPYIEFENIDFVEVEGFSSPDSLKLSIYFADGDMDLGIDYSEVDSPFHKLSYFLETGNGNLTRITSYPIEIRYEGSTTDDAYALRIPAGATGKLASIRTREKPEYQYLPRFDDYDIYCHSYSYAYSLGYVYIPKNHTFIIDNTYNIKNTFVNGEAREYVLNDTLLVEENWNRINIEVDFLLKKTDGTFEEFDFKAEFCSTYDGTFPFVGGKLSKSAQIKSGPFTIKGISKKEGVLTYNMMGSGFIYTFQDKTMKLRIKIRDRALHESNIIETPEFRLQDI